MKPSIFLPRFGALLMNVKVLRASVNFCQKSTQPKVFWIFQHRCIQSIFLLGTFTLIFISFEQLENPFFALIKQTAQNKSSSVQKYVDRHETRTSNMALLVGGAVRSFVLPTVHMGLKEFVVDVLQRRQGLNVYVIMNLSINDASSWGTASQFPMVNPEQLKRAIAVLEPASVLFYQSSNLPINMSNPLNRGCQGEVYHLTEGAIAQFDVSESLYKQACDVELQQKVAFNWFIRTRPDYAWFAPIQMDFNRLHAESMLMHDQSWPWPIFDGFYAVHASLAVRMWINGSSTLRNIPCDITRAMNRGLNPEALLAAVAEWKNAVTVTTNIGNTSTFARGHGFDCPRLSIPEYQMDEKLLNVCRNASKAYLQELSLWRSNALLK